jgi:hypothetical protein
MWWQNCKLWLVLGGVVAIIIVIIIIAICVNTGACSGSSAPVAESTTAAPATAAPNGLIINMLNALVPEQLEQ